ncbi:hypothetical protein U9M48_026804 [Paspalum notatum var. saurae]|uniref:BZIP domain-containing protein n=1 Tax=Paspalum notatum var. saurae TaxID=547442 RepID=A0AAQ3WZI7_PASNO
MTAADGEACAVVATAADIICSLRGADLAGWTPPWRKPLPPACDGARDEDARAGGLAWPAEARGKRTRSSRSGSAEADASAAAKETTTTTTKKKKPRRGARGSPASPLDYSGGSGSGSGASTSGGEDGAFCSSHQPAAATTAPPTVAVFQPAAAAAPAPAAPSKVGGLAGRRAILPVPPPRPAAAGQQQRARKKMRLPEIQQMVRSLSAENDALREEMKALQRACAGLSKENSKLETRLDHSGKLNGVISAETKGKKPKPDERQRAAEHGDSQNDFVLPDLNLPADA